MAAQKAERHRKADRCALSNVIVALEQGDCETAARSLRELIAIWRAPPAIMGNALALTHPRQLMVDRAVLPMLTVLADTLDPAAETKRRLRFRLRRRGKPVDKASKTKARIRELEIISEVYTVEIEKLSGVTKSRKNNPTRATIDRKGTYASVGKHHKIDWQTVRKMRQKFERGLLPRSSGRRQASDKEWNLIR